MIAKFKAAPLSGGFMAMSVLGFIATMFYTAVGKLPFYTWGFAFMLVFAVMFIASFISLENTDPDELLKQEEKEMHKKLR